MIASKVYVVGIDNYMNEPKLSFCARDAELFATTIERFPGVSAAEVLTAQGQNPSEYVTAADIRDLLGRIRQIRAGSDEAIVFYFAGHGFEHGGRDYVEGSDSSSRAPESAVRTDDIVAALRATRAPLTMLVLDACRSYTERGVTKFGENTLDEAKKHSVVTLFGCGVGEVCRESNDLDGGHGLFTFCLCELLREKRQLVPILAESELEERVARQCLRLHFPAQVPHVALSSLSNARLDWLSGALVELSERPKRMILVCGPANTGKSTVGARVSQGSGFVQLEMSSYAYQRFLPMKERGEYHDSIQGFMEEVVWKDGEYDVIAQDLLASSHGVNQLIVCGPRRPEEVETFRNAGFEIDTLYVYTDSRTRYGRHFDVNAARFAGDFGLGLDEFIRRDIVENSWGLPKIARMMDSAIIRNESVDGATNRIVDRMVRRGWFTRR